MYACMCVCMYAGRHVCMHACMYVVVVVVILYFLQHIEDFTTELNRQKKLNYKQV